MRAVVLTPDLIFASRIESAARKAGTAIERAGVPAELPDEAGIDLLIVDWDSRGDDWGEAIRTWARRDGTRVILVGPHTDLAAHGAARDAGLGPMWARSKLLSELGTLFRPAS